LRHRIIEVRFLWVKSGAFTAFSLDASGQRLATGHQDGKIRLWDLVNASELIMEQAFTGRYVRDVTRIALSPNGKHLATGRSTSRQLLLFRCTELASGWEFRSGWFAEGHNQDPYFTQSNAFLSFNGDGSRLYFGMNAGQFQALRVPTENESGPVRAPLQRLLDIFAPPPNPLIESILFSKEEFSLSDAEFTVDQTRFVTWHRTRALVWHKEEAGWVLLGKFDHDSSVRSARITEDGQTLVTLTGRSIHVWDVASQKRLWHRVVTEQMLFALAIHPNGRQIAVGGNEREVVLVDMEDGAESHRFSFNIGRIRKIEFTLDGSMALAMGTTRRMAIWDAE
jgi:hypothetical protein